MRGRKRKFAPFPFRPKWDNTAQRLVNTVSRLRHGGASHSGEHRPPACGSRQLAANLTMVRASISHVALGQRPSAAGEPPALPNLNPWKGHMPCLFPAHAIGESFHPQNRIRSGYFLSLPALQSCPGGEQVRGGDESGLSKVRTTNIGPTTGCSKRGVGRVR